MTRSCLLEVIGEDYVRTARAKGVAERLVVVRHALPNALLPVITVSGILMGFVLDRKSTRLNSSHSQISYAVFCLKKKKKRDEVMELDEQRENALDVDVRTSR